MEYEREEIASGRLDSQGVAEQLLADLYHLPLWDQVKVLRGITPRILGRLQEIEREKFLADLRKAPRADMRMDRHTSAQPVARAADAIAEDILSIPLEAGLHVLHLAAPRIVGELDVRERDELIDALDREVYGVEAGRAPGPILH